MGKVKLPKDKIDQLTNILIEAQEKIEGCLNYPYPKDDGSPRADLNWKVFVEARSGLNTIIESIKAQHIEVNKNRKHSLAVADEQKARVCERDLADRRNTERMTARQRRIVDAILGN